VLLSATFTVLPFAVTAGLCIWAYQPFATRVRGGVFSKLEATFLFCLVSLVLVPMLIGVTTALVLHYLYTNYPQTRPQSWDVAIGYSAVAYYLCSVAMAVVACMVGGWKLFRRENAPAT